MLKPPEHQAAGHRASDGQLGPLVDGSGLFFKPLQSDDRGATELAFYTSLSSHPQIPTHILPFFPTFHGTRLLPASDGSGPHSHLVLDDLLAGLRLPSVIDVKIGSRTWSPSVSPSYLQKCISKDLETTSSLLGFRISGLHINSDRGFYRPGRVAVRRFNSDDVRRVLRRFVSSDPNSDGDPDCCFASVVYGGSAGVLSQLLDLKAWFEDQTLFHFCSTSVLLAYEKDGHGGARVMVRLVDFAHVVEGNGVIDHNFLGGLCSLIQFISNILHDSLQSSDSNCSLKEDGTKVVKTREGGIVATWESSEMLLFCDLCIAEIRIGNRSTTHLSMEGWNSVTAKVHERTGKMYVVTQFKNKWDQLKKDWKLWKELKRDETGLGWDPVKRTVDASDEWWKERIEVVPAAKKFRYSGISPELEEKLCAMFNEVVVSGDSACAPNLMTDPSSPDNVGFEQEYEMIGDQNTSHNMSDDHGDNVRTVERGVSSQRRKRIFESSKQSGMRRTRLRKYSIDHLVESTIRVRDSLTHPHTVSAPRYTIHEAIEEMERHPEICSDLILYDFATIFLMDNKKRELFLSLPSSKKVWWLKNRQITCTGSGGM